MKAKDVGGTSQLLLLSAPATVAAVAVAVEAVEAVEAIIGVANFLCLRMIFRKSWRGLGKALTSVPRGSTSKFSPKMAWYMPAAIE